jgi:D-alanine transaminase
MSASPQHKTAFASAELVYVNGEYLPAADAKISVFDRGFLFADGVYEVTAVVDGCLIDYAPHIARLKRSLNELGMAMPCSEDELQKIHLELIARNGTKEGLVYLQVTRGAEQGRNFPFPEDATPSLVMFSQSADLVNDPKAETGVALASFEDIRWARRDIKSVALLPQVLAKQAATSRGAFEAVMTQDGYVTEGGSSSLGFVKEDGTIVLRPFSNAILPSITRQAVTKLADQSGVEIEERLFTLDELMSATEVFMASATALVMPVVKIDDQRIGGGQPGPVVRRLRALYFEMAEQQVREQSDAWS